MLAIKNCANNVFEKYFNFSNVYYNYSIKNKEFFFKISQRSHGKFCEKTLTP